MPGTVALGPSFLVGPGRIGPGAAFLVALLVGALSAFLPRSRHPRREIRGALLNVMPLPYLITAALAASRPSPLRTGSVFPIRNKHSSCRPEFSSFLLIW